MGKRLARTIGEANGDSPIEFAKMGPLKQSLEKLGNQPLDFGKRKQSVKKMEDQALDFGTMGSLEEEAMKLGDQPAHFQTL